MERNNKVRRVLRRSRRKGALLSAEMLIVFPVVIVLLFGMVETSMLISSYNQIKHASSVACRSCAVTPGDGSAAAAVALQETLRDEELINAVTVVCQDSGVSGEICRITIELPMSEATPDLLGVLGFHLEGTLEASTAMRKE